jgi:hypothetical protein
MTPARPGSSLNGLDEVLDRRAQIIAELDGEETACRKSDVRTSLL